MIRINEIKMPLGATEEDVKIATAKALKIKENDIAIDKIADEYIEDAPAYGKTDDKGVYNFDDDEPEKFEAEVAEKRDTSDDPKSRFKTSFMWAM